MPLQDVKEQAERKTINGKEYHRQVLRKVILYPQKIGDFTMGPINCTLDIPEDGGRSSFFFRDTKREQCVTNRIKINVKSLPSPIPTSFTGAVGAFDMKASLNKNTVQTGESLILRMQITGDGDPKIVQAPIIPKINGMESYEPSVIKDETYIRADRLYMDKVFEYIFVPTVDSSYTLKPEFSYFSTTSKTFETTVTEEFKVVVVKGGSNDLSKVNGSSQVIFSPMVESVDLKKMDSSFFGSKFYFLALILLFVLSFGMIYIKKKNIENDKLQIITAQKSINISLQSLKRASEFMSSNQPGEFYKEISHATTGYLQNKFKIANTELGFSDVRLKLQELGIDNLIISEYESIQQFCEKAKFAGQFEKMPEVYYRAANFIDSIEQASN